MATVGYIRVSTVEQHTERQLDGVALDKVFEDKCSGGTTDRPQLKALIEYVREGDTVVVHDISRMARNVSDLLELVDLFNSKGVTVAFKTEGLTFTGEDNPMQQLMLSMLGAVYQFERSMILERQREGIAKAKEAGRYKGRKKKIDDVQILESLKSGLSIRKTAAALGISISTVQRAKQSMNADV